MRILYFVGFVVGAALGAWGFFEDGYIRLFLGIVIAGSSMYEFLELIDDAPSVRKRPTWLTHVLIAAGALLFTVVWSLSIW